jgi:hypothetical protein
MGWGVRMVIFKLIGFILVVVALMLLGADVVTTLEKGGDLMHGDLMIRSLDQVLTLLQWDIKPWIQTTLPDPVGGWLLTALGWPGWADTGVLGLILGFIGGRGG